MRRINSFLPTNGEDSTYYLPAIDTDQHETIQDQIAGQVIGAYGKAHLSTGIRIPLTAYPFLWFVRSMGRTSFRTGFTLAILLILLALMASLPGQTITPAGSPLISRSGFSLATTRK